MLSVLALCFAAASAQASGPRRKLPTESVTQTQQAPEPAAETRIRDNGAIRSQRTPRRANGTPSIMASQNPVLISLGQSAGTTTISWDAGPNHPYAEVWLEGRDSRIIEQGAGSFQFEITLGRTYVFRLEDAGELLDAVTVTAVTGGTGGDVNGGRVVTRPKTEGIEISNIADVSVEPRSNGVAITFWSTPDANPTVEIGTAAPFDAGGKWNFPAGRSVGYGSAVASQKSGPLSRKVGTKVNTLHRFDTNLPGFPELRYETEHWYIITAQKSGGEPGVYQTIGRFTTTAPTIGVRVVFERIHVLDDSDELSPAEITLHTFVNFGEPGAKSTRFLKRQMSTGGTFDINKEFVILNAPKYLELAVNAEDDDAGPGDPFRTDPQDIPFSGPGKNDTEQWNVAKGTWNLTRFPTGKNEVYRNNFKLRSVDRGTLQFEVYGYWEITRTF